MSFSLNFNPDARADADMLYSASMEIPDDVSKMTEIFEMYQDTMRGIVLLRAAARSKTGVVKHIVAQKNKMLPNIRDETGKTALFWSLFSSAPTFKIIECAQILIDAGANMNARLNEDNTGSNLLGFCLEILDLKKMPDFVAEGKLSKEEMDKKFHDVKVVAAFLLARGAKCYVGGVGDLESKDLKEVNPEVLDRYFTILNEIKEFAIANHVNDSWSQLRLVQLGKITPGSELAECPPELLDLISREIVVQSLEDLRPH